MKVTKEQKIYLGLLGLGLVAFLLDRTVFTPSAADGADLSDLLVTKSSATVAHLAGGVAKPAASPTSNPVAQKLAALSDSMHLSETNPRDAFTPGPSWVVKSPVLAADTKTFEQKHHLDGVMVGRAPGRDDRRQAGCRRRNARRIQACRGGAGVCNAARRPDHRRITKPITPRYLSVRDSIATTRIHLLGPRRRCNRYMSCPVAELLPDMVDK